MRLHAKTLMGYSVLCAVTLCLAHGAQGDTFHLKTGVSIDGELVSHNDGVFRVNAGGRMVNLREKEVIRHEPNSKTGRFDKGAALKRGQKRLEELEKTTGLTLEQRQEIDAILDLMLSKDPQVLAQARRRLFNLAKNRDLFPYMENMLQSLSPRLAPNVLEGLATLDKERAKPILRAYLTHVDAGVRATAILNLGKVQDPTAAELLVRGFKDEDPNVRLAACNAIGMLKVKGATPCLLANLQSDELRLQNASRDALAFMWKAELGDTPPPVSVSGWTEFWEKNNAIEGLVFNPESITPLVEPGTRFEDE